MRNLPVALRRLEREVIDLKTSHERGYSIFAFHQYKAKANLPFLGDPQFGYYVWELRGTVADGELFPPIVQPQITIKYRGAEKHRWEYWSGGGSGVFGRDIVLKMTYSPFVPIPAGTKLEVVALLISTSKLNNVKVVQGTGW